MSALTMMGSRKWWSHKHLIRFGIDHCEVTRKQAEALYDECLQAMVITAHALEDALKDAQNPQQEAVMMHLLGLMRES